MSFFEPNMQDVAKEVKDLAEKPADSGSKKGDIYYWQEGPNLMRILPPWSQAGRVFKVRHVHFFSEGGSLICPKHTWPERAITCPVCEIIETIEKRGKGDEVWRTKASFEAYANCIKRVLTNPQFDYELVIPKFSQNIYNWIMQSMVDPKYGNVTHPYQGLDLVITKVLQRVNPQNPSADKSNVKATKYEHRWAEDQFLNPMKGPCLFDQNAIPGILAAMKNLDEHPFMKLLEGDKLVELTRKLEEKAANLRNRYGILTAAVAGMQMAPNYPPPMSPQGYANPAQHLPPAAVYSLPPGVAPPPAGFPPQQMYTPAPQPQPLPLSPQFAAPVASAPPNVIPPPMVPFQAPPTYAPPQQMAPPAMNYAPPAPPAPPDPPDPPAMTPPPMSPPVMNYAPPAPPQPVQQAYAPAYAPPAPPSPTSGAIISRITKQPVPQGGCDWYGEFQNNPQGKFPQCMLCPQELQCKDLTNRLKAGQV